MARHQRYDRAARMSRKAASAAFDSRMEYENIGVAENAVRFLWEYFSVKARLQGATVIYEAPTDAKKAREVKQFLRQELSSDRATSKYLTRPEEERRAEREAADRHNAKYKYSAATPGNKWEVRRTPGPNYKAKLREESDPQVRRYLAGYKAGQWYYLHTSGNEQSARRAFNDAARSATEGTWLLQLTHNGKVITSIGTDDMTGD